MQAPDRRNQTILGLGVCVCGALLLLSGTVADGIGLAVGVAGIAVLANRPAEESDASRDDTPPDDA